jgi:ribonuclease D
VTDTGTSSRPTGGDTPALVADAAGFDEVIARLRTVERYALDTEFHREKTYWPQVALVQVAWPEGPEGPPGLALIDPLAVDLAPLAEILRGPATMVAHAAEQDLEVLQLACGCGPSRLLDTQVAAGFCGHGSSSLASLSAIYLDLDVAKGDRLTDWSARPLSRSQLRYAAADVDHLLELADRIVADVERRGRLAWAEEESELLRTRRQGGSDPRRAWWRLRDARQLKGSSRGVAQEVAAWREERARSLDVPVRHVVPDLALQSIAHRPPATSADLAAVRGLESRFLRGDAGAGLLAAIERGRSLPAADIQAPPADEVPKELRPAVALAMAWTAQLARDEAVDTTLLATRSDVVAFLRDDPAARLGVGWRAELAGTALRQLLTGEASLAFDGHGGLVLEARSHRPLGSPPGR